MAAVGTPARHVQKEIELGRRRNGERSHASDCRRGAGGALRGGFNAA
jgi:hypothetical protein